MYQRSTVYTMAARQIMRLGVLRQTARAALANTCKRSASMVTCVKRPQVLCTHRFPQLNTCQRASFHSSGRCLDENHFIIQDEDDFKEKVVNSDSAVIVDFHAEWCNPCKALAPVLDAALQTAGGQVKLAKVDIDDLQDLAIGYGVEAVPTVLAFKDGQKVDKFVGYQSQEKVEAFVEKLLR